MINPCFTYCEPQKKDDFVFFSCGALIPRKRFDLLIEAFTEAFSDDPGVKLRIGGSGAMRDELTESINSRGMSGRISLLGQLSREATLEEYKNCDAFALPSAAETYGPVYREAMAVGRPVISTRHGGFGSDWSDSFGELIDIDDKSQLVKALKHIYENYSDYDLKKISEECLKGCSETGVAEQISGYLAQKI
jgi:glycosyltransferase involved in cell wall biosynthesis